MDALNSGTGDTATLAARAAAAFDSLTSAQIRAADSGIRVADSYTRLASAQDLATRNEQKLRTIMDEPLKSASGGAASSGSGSGGGRSYLLQAAGYTAAYGAYSAVSGSLGRDAVYSRLLGSTAAMTGLSPSAAAQLNALTTAQAASGVQPYNRSTLLQGDYSLASLGIGHGNAGTINQVESIIAKGSAASGATDTSILGDTLTTLIAAYGLNTSSVVANTQKLSDQLTVGIRLGKVDAPGFATAAGGPVANMAKTLGVSTADVISAIAAESVGGIATGELGNDTYALLAHSARPTRTQQREAAALGIQYDSSFWGKNGIAGGSNIIEQAMQRQGITGAMQAPVLGALLGKQDAANAFMALQSGNVQGFAPQVAGSAGATNSAFTTSQSYSGAKLQDAETKLATGFDNMTTHALPSLVTALGGLTDGFNSAAALFSLFGKSNSSAALMHFTDPLDKGFGNLKIATQEANRYGTSTPASTENTGVPVLGGLMNANNWLSGKLSGLGGAVYQNVPGARAIGNQLDLSSTPTGRTIVPPAIRGGGPTPDHPQLTGGGGPTYEPHAIRSGNLAAGAIGAIYAQMGRQSAAEAYTGATGVNSPAYLASISGASAAKSAGNANIGAGLNFGYENLGTAPTAAALAKTNTDALNRTMRDLQNTISIQQLGGNAGGTATAQAALLAFETKNAKALKLDPSDIALLAAQNAAALMATNPTTNLHPFYQKQAGLGSFEAGAGSTLVRAGGVNPSVEAIRALERTIDALRAENSGLLREIARNTGMRAASTAANPNHGGMH